MFIDKIKSKFKEKFPNVNLSTKRVQEIAEKLNGLITEEDQIDSQLTLLDTVTPFAEIARLDDVERGLKAKPKPKPDADPDPKPEPKPTDEIPEWAQAIIDQNKTLTEKLAQTEQQTAQQRREAEFKKRIEKLPKEAQELKLKHFGRMNFENDEDLQEYLQDVEDEVTTVLQKQTDENASAYKPKPAAQAAVSKEDQAAIDAAVANMKL